MVHIQLRHLLQTMVAATVFAFAGVAHAAAPYIVSDTSGNLLRVDSATGAATVIGNTGSAGLLTDLAVSPSGALWGITFTTLYKINPNTAALTAVGDHGVFGANALTFASDGTLYMASSNSAALYTVNTANAATTTLAGSMGTNSAGDLAFNNGQLYLAGVNGQLVRIGLGATVTGTNIGAFGVADVYGLTTNAAGTLLAIAGRTIYQTNIATGALSPLLSYAGFGTALGFAQPASNSFVPILFYLLDD